eukprot:6152052-Amphidinium_carterae.1
MCIPVLEVEASAGYKQPMTAHHAKFYGHGCMEKLSVWGGKNCIQGSGPEDVHSPRGHLQLVQEQEVGSTTS